MLLPKRIATAALFAFIAGALGAPQAQAQSTDLEDYVIFALESAKLKNPHATGSIGVNETGGKLSMGRGSFLADGTEVVGDITRIGAGSSIYDLFANTVSGRFDPAIVRGSGPQSFTPPIIPVLPPVADFLCGGPAITVRRGEGAVLPPGVYGNIVFRDDATVTLSGGTYTMCRLKIGKGVLVVTASPTVINVVSSVVISNGSLLSPPPGGSRPKINLAGGSLRFGKRTVVRALIDARFAKVGMGNGDFSGRLIARKVRSDFGLQLELPVCGDGFLDDGEECDDGNGVDTDGCSNDCTEGPPLTPTPAETPTPTPTPKPTATPTPTPAPVCRIEVTKTASPDTLPPPPDNACQGKVEWMELRYDGRGCGASDNQQGTKASCTGDAAFASPVRIVARDKNDQVLLDQAGVALGDSVVVAAAASGILSSETRVTVRNASGAVVEFDLIHTSCSRPLNPGDRFGSLEVVALQTTEGGLHSLADNVTYTYEVTNAGNATLFGITVIDDKLGELPESPIAELPPGEKATLQATTLITETTENQVLVSGELEGGQSCNASASAVVTVQSAPVACTEGKKVASVTLRYTGEGCSASDNDQGDKASCGCPSKDKKDDDDSGGSPCEGADFASPVWVVGRSGSSTVLDAFPVALGDEVTAGGAAAGKGALRGDLWIDVLFEGAIVEHDVIHVSCSQPLAVGDKFGSFEVTGLVLVDKR